MKLRSARRLRDGLFTAGLAILLLAYVWPPLCAIGAGIACAGLILHFLFCRCPYCGREVVRNRGDFCKFCGKPLE